jgi:minor extracellular protease Epr
MVVAAAGNAGPSSPPRYPAAYERVLAVTAVDQDNRVYLRAGRGEHLDYAAPGVNIQVASGSTADAYHQVSGTSFATPLITGLVIYYAAGSGAWGLDQLNSIMREDTLDLGEPGPDPIYGYGLIGASLLKSASEQ